MYKFHPCKKCLLKPICKGKTFQEILPKCIKLQRFLLKTNEEEFTYRVNKTMNTLSIKRRLIRADASKFTK